MLRPAEPSAALVVPLEDLAALAAGQAGPKAATLARLRRAGLPVPDGFCLLAGAYRAQLAAAGVAESAARVVAVERPDARRLALGVRLGLLRSPLGAAISGSLDRSWERLAAGPVALAAVRSSALCEDTVLTSFAGQFETFLGVGTREDLGTAVRGCWASLWATRALRYMQAHDVDPARTAMAVLVQRLVPARAAGGALSATPEGDVLLTAVWGLGSSVAQGEVVPDRYVLGRDGALRDVEPGRKDRAVRWSAESGPRPEAVPRDLVGAPCLDEGQATALARLVLEAEAILATPVEVEWALEEAGLRILQARPLRVETAAPTGEAWLRKPGLRGQPAGVGWGEGPARVVLSEHDLEHVALGDVLVTQVGGPALTAVLPRVAGVVTERGGSTSHLAALARERGIPAVLGVLDATRRIPEGATVAVDGITGIVRWTR